MAGSGSAQQRLDKIVQVIAADMVAEVCSAYIMRAGEVLELFATEGLRREAVHRTRLRVGEGRRRGHWRWPTRKPIPTSPIARRPARRSTIR
jgi:signal transduction protein with GAF and PtsI domain